MVIHAFSPCLAPVVAVAMAGEAGLGAWKKLQSADGVAQLVEVEAGAEARQSLKVALQFEAVVGVPAVSVGVEVPLQAQVVEVPLQAQVVEVPLQAQVVEVPLQAQVVEVPLQAQVVEVPLQAQVVAVPLQAQVEVLLLQAQVSPFSAAAAMRFDNSLERNLERLTSQPLL